MWKLLTHQAAYFLRFVYRTFKLPPFTVEYPFVVKSLPGSARTGLKNNFAECTGCLKCQEICPVDAIKIEGFQYSTTMKRPTTSKGILFEREIESFQIDYNQCVFCGLCVTGCPTGSLTFTKSFVKPELQAKSMMVDLVHVPRSMRPGSTHEN